MNKKHAQSTLEYIMIIVTVLAAVTVMIPYVFRGVNAYMRSWEVSVQEARHDVGQEVSAWIIDGAEAPPPPECDYDTPEQCNNNSECQWAVLLDCSSSCSAEESGCVPAGCPADYHPGFPGNPCDCDGMHEVGFGECCEYIGSVWGWTQDCIACCPN